MLSVGLFSSLLKYDDSVIGMMSCASKILAGFIYAYATTVSVLLIGRERGRRSNAPTSRTLQKQLSLMIILFSVCI